MRPRVPLVLLVALVVAAACTAAQVATTRRVLDVAAAACSVADAIRQCVERARPAPGDGGAD